MTNQDNTTILADKLTNEATRYIKGILANIAYNL